MQNGRVRLVQSKSKRLDGGQFSLLGAGPWSFISQDVPQEDKQTTVAADRSNKQRHQKLQELSAQGRIQQVSYY